MRNQIACLFLIYIGTGYGYFCSGGDHPISKGDPEKGHRYLIYGDYVDAGIPYDLYVKLYGKDKENLLDRTGDNAYLPPEVTAIDSPEGARIVVANCFQCHAQKIAGTFVLGLGNSFGDFTEDRSRNLPAVGLAVRVAYGNDSPELANFQRFSSILEGIGPHVTTPKVGLNPATKLAVALAAYRDPESLTWLDEPHMKIPTGLASDIPPWWNVKKKESIYFTAGGKGHFEKFMMASSLLTLHGIENAEEIEKNFADVSAFIHSLEPPRFPGEIDPVRSERGRRLFEESCADCHGHYGNPKIESYPNKLIPLAKIGTDPLLASDAYTSEDSREWFNKSWFGVGPNGANFEPANGYVAPPLDGIWATAPYLHNGSVPTILELLDSERRPVYWQRSGDPSDYDFENVGWNYEERDHGKSKWIFDTTVPGYGNEGHTFADDFTEEERRDLIEYLKTL